MRHTIQAFLMLLTVFPLAAQTLAPAQLPIKAVLVTGASTGIGRKVTERLAREGYFVYAGARKEADLKSLGALKNVQALRLDVTKSEDIAAALATITHAGRGLYGLVNNAGIATEGTIADTTMEEFDLLMQVNLYGPIRMIRAFEPLIIAQQGRITTIGSISGVLASSELGAYVMSKHAMEGLTDVLAKELEPKGVLVSIVEPGNYDSDIEKSFARRTGGDLKDADRSMYKPPEEVAAAVDQALFEAKPKRRYLVVPNQEEAERTIAKQIQQLVQLNEGQPYSYDRAGLIKMLDAALKDSRPKVQ